MGTFILTSQRNYYVAKLIVERLTAYGITAITKAHMIFTTAKYKTFYDVEVTDNDMLNTSSEEIAIAKKRLEIKLLAEGKSLRWLVNGS